MSNQSIESPNTWRTKTLPDADGAPHAIDDWLSRGPVLLGIYKSSCAASKVMMPVLARIAHAHTSDGLATIGIAQDSANITRSFARRYGIDYPILLEAPEYAVSSGLDIRATPTVFVLRQDGTVAYTTMGFLRDQVKDIEQAVAAVLSVEPATIIAAGDPDIPLFVPG